MSILDELGLNNWEESRGGGRMLHHGYLIAQHETNLVGKDGHPEPGWITAISRLGGQTVYSRTDRDRAQGERLALQWCRLFCPSALKP